MPALEKIAQLNPNLEFFCLEVSGQSINDLIDRYNRHLSTFNARKASTNRADRYTPEAEKAAFEYLTDLNKRLNNIIKTSKNPNAKTPDENIKESADNYKTYMLLMRPSKEKIALFTPSTTTKSTTASTGSRDINPDELKTAPKSVENSDRRDSHKIQEDIEKAKQKIDSALIEDQIAKDAVLAEKLQRKQSFFGKIATNLPRPKSGSVINIGNPKLDHASRAKIVQKVSNSKGSRVLDVEEMIAELPLKQPKRTDSIFAIKKAKSFETFTETKPDDLFDIFAKAEVTERKLSEDPIAGKDYFSVVLSELVKHKTQLGGSPVFGQNKPFIDDKDSGKFMFGVPMAAVKDWMRMTIAQGWAPRPFWRNIAKKFGVSDKQMSKYEEAHLCIQRFGLLIANKARFWEILNSSNTERYTELSQITGLAWHPIKNSPSVEKEYIDFIEQFLTVYFERAKKDGSDALQEYFEAFKGVCLEDRARNLLEYAMKHPLEEGTTPMPSDWDTGSPAEEAFMKEVQVLGIQKQDLPTPKELYEFLQGKGIFDLEFTTKDGTKAKPTKESYYIWAQDMVDMCVLNDDNDSPSPHV